MNESSIDNMMHTAIEAIIKGAKKIELENTEWTVTAYSMGMPGQIRIDLKRKDNK